MRGKQPKQYPTTHTHTYTHTHTHKTLPHTPTCDLSKNPKPYHIRKMSTLPMTSEVLSAFHPVKSAYLSADDHKTSAYSSAPFPCFSAISGFVGQNVTMPNFLCMLCQDSNSTIFIYALSLYPVYPINFLQRHRTRRRAEICRPMVVLLVVLPSILGIGILLGKSWESFGMLSEQLQLSHIRKLKLTTSQKISNRS